MLKTLSLYVIRIDVMMPRKRPYNGMLRIQGYYTVHIYKWLPIMHDFAVR